MFQSRLWFRAVRTIQSQRGLNTEQLTQARQRFSSSLVFLCLSPPRKQAPADPHQCRAHKPELELWVHLGVALIDLTFQVERKQDLQIIYKLKELL